MPGGFSIITFIAWNLNGKSILLAVERMARQHRWAAAIQKLEQVGEERVVE